VTPPEPAEVWSGPVETEIQGRLRSTVGAGPALSHGATNAGNVNTGAASGEGKSTLGVRATTRDVAQIKRLSVHQGSLILEACRDVRRASMREKMECEATQSHCTQPAGAVNRVCSAGGEI
jgi:hypothetical protein